MVDIQMEVLTREETDPVSGEETPVEALDLRDVIGEGQFQDERAQEPVFHHVYEEGLAKREEEVLNPGLANSYPHFEV